jgi:hypothetical protein
LWVDIYVAAGTALTVWRAWCVHARDCIHPHAAFLAGETWWRALDLCDAVLTHAPSINLLVAILIWLWVTPRGWWHDSAPESPGARLPPTR